MGRKSHNYRRLQRGPVVEPLFTRWKCGLTAFKQWASDPGLHPWCQKHAPVAFDPRGRVLQEAFTT